MDTLPTSTINRSRIDQAAWNRTSCGTGTMEQQRCSARSRRSTLYGASGSTEWHQFADPNNL